MKAVSTSLVLPQASHTTAFYGSLKISSHITRSCHFNASSCPVEKIGIKVCGRKELTSTTEEIPSPWEFSFYDFPQEVLYGGSMIFY